MLCVSLGMNRHSLQDTGMELWHSCIFGGSLLGCRWPWISHSISVLTSSPMERTPQRILI